MGESEYVAGAASTGGSSPGPSTGPSANPSSTEPTSVAAAGPGAGSGTTFLEALAADDRAALEGSGIRRRYPRGARLFFEGDPASEVYVVLDGQVKISVAAKDGREILLAIRSDGDIIGELGPLDGAPRSANASLLADTELLVLTDRAFLALLDERAGIGRLLLEMLAGRMRDMSVRQLEFGVDDALARVCRRLVELGERYGRDEGGRLVVDGPLSQGEIASWSGLSRQAVVKALGALRSLGWVETRGSTFVLLDAEAVRSRATLTSSDL